MTGHLKATAHHIIGQAVRSGRVLRPSICQRCGAADTPLKDGRTSIQGHHHKGYDHPLDVEWLCISCHRAETPAPYGERSMWAKVTWEIVSAIRARYETGESYYAIARELRLNPTTVHRIVTQRSWPEHARPATPAETQADEVGK